MKWFFVGLESNEELTLYSCDGSLTLGDGWGYSLFAGPDGDGWGDGWDFGAANNGTGNGAGFSGHIGNSYGDGFGCCWSGWTEGDGESATQCQ